LDIIVVPVKVVLLIGAYVELASDCFKYSDDALVNDK